MTNKYKEVLQNVISYNCNDEGYYEISWDHDDEIEPDVIKKAVTQDDFDPYDYISDTLLQYNEDYVADEMISKTQKAIYATGDAKLIAEYHDSTSIFEDIYDAGYRGIKLNVDYYDDFPTEYNEAGTVYNRQATVEYAKKWGIENGEHDLNTYNRDFFCSISKENGGDADSPNDQPDCANFASQCVYSGGVKMKTNWYMKKTNALYSNYVLIDSHLRDFLSNCNLPTYNDWHTESGWTWTLSWGFDEDQYEYFKKYFKKSYKPITITSENFDFDVECAITQIRPGDLIYFMSADKAQHVAIITNTQNGEIAYAGHTRHTFGSILSKDLVASNGGKVEIIDLESKRLCSLFALE